MIEACPRTPQEREGCPHADTKRGCYSDENHLYWPARIYTTDVEKAFRNLPENKEQVCRWLHDDFHEFSFPPQKPDLLEMLRALSIPLEGNEHEQAA